MLNYCEIVFIAQAQIHRMATEQKENVYLHSKQWSFMCYVVGLSFEKLGNCTRLLFSAGNNE